MFCLEICYNMNLITYISDERSVMYLYTMTVFQWDNTAFSHFRTYLSTAYVIVMLFGIPFMTKVLNWKDTVSKDRTYNCRQVTISALTVSFSEKCYCTILVLVSVSDVRDSPTPAVIRRGFLAENIFTDGTAVTCDCDTTNA